MQKTSTPPIDPRAEPAEELPPYLDKTASLPGWPGYRTRPGRSGYDPLDTRYELAHMEGLFCRYLFTGKLRTRNPFYLSLMAFFGLAGFFSMILAVFEVSQGGGLFPGVWCNIVPAGTVGFALLVNFALNLLHRRK